MTRHCVNCTDFDLKSAPEVARLGLGYCKAIDITKGAYVTATFARECDKFKPASADVVAKRLAYIGETTT